MDASAHSDLRDLVPPVVVWLGQAGFQEIDCGAAASDAATIAARWEGGDSVFRLLVQATRTEARCHLWSREQGMCFTWMRVQSLAQVQLLLSQNWAFQQAQSARGAQPAAPAAPGPGPPPTPA